MKDNIFGKNLKEARISKKETQKEFAETLGIAPTTYSQYEMGKREPKFDLLVKISDILDVSVDRLLRTNTDYINKQSPKKINLSREVKECIKEEINKSLKQAVLQL